MSSHCIDAYLNDHLATAMAGVTLAEQAAGSHGSDEIGGFLTPLAAEIKADHTLLKRLIRDIATSEGASTPAASAAPDDAVSLEIDLVSLASGFGHRLYNADLQVTPAQSEQYVRSLQLTQPTSRRRLYFTTRAIFVTAAEDVETFDRVFTDVFGSIEHDADRVDVEADPSASHVALSAGQHRPSVIAQAMDSQLHVYRRTGWRAGSASTWVEGNRDRRLLPRAAEVSGSPRLQDIFTLETLSTGAESTLSMWKALHNVAGTHPALAKIDFDELETRAETQRARIEDMVREIAPQALTDELAGAAA